MCNQKNSFTRHSVTDDTALNLLSAVTKIPGRIRFTLNAADRLTLPVVIAQEEPRIPATACEVPRTLLLACQTRKAGREGNIAAPRVDIQTAAASVARING